MNLLDKQFDRRSEEKAEELLSKAENEIAALSQYTEFLIQKKYEEAKEHLEEVEKLEEDIEKVWKLFNAQKRSSSISGTCTQATSRCGWSDKICDGVKARNFDTRCFGQRASHLAEEI